MENYTKGNIIMTINNDERILALREQIETKRKELGKQPRFTPITTCLLEVNGTRINLHTIFSVKEINALLVYVNMYVISAKDLNIDPTEIILSGFGIQDWIEDLRSKANAIVWLEKNAQLLALQRQLDKLLSNDKKTELEINEIANLLK